jgi:hypothetical protein
MSRTCRLLCGAAVALAVLSGRAGAQQATDKAGKKAEKPEVEVVFCLDTTGSMGGLIDAAKQKIWAICNQIAGSRWGWWPSGTGGTPTSPRSTT